MREILFRGKPKNLKAYGWVYGQLLYHSEEMSKIYSDEIDSPVGVIPDTVGQFTGLTDKNGKKIFEGDIVRILGNQDVDDWKNVDYAALIAFIDGGFCAIDGTVEEHAFRRYALSRLDFSLEVIGNIYDNPELLEED